MGYNRMFAVNYARVFWNRVCHDGRVATKSGYPRKINGVTVTPGLPFRAIGRIDREEDCTHFISCCVGQTAKFKFDRRELGPFEDFMLDPDSAVGGGLHIPSPWASIGVYGHDTTSVLMGALVAHGARIIARPDVAPDTKTYAHWFWKNPDSETLEAIRKNLTPGDVLAYAAWADRSAYAHMALLVGPGAHITCHTYPRWREPYSDVGYEAVTLIKLP